jgi:23S rRNA (uracil1939-C5)-methyltransferase
VKELAGLSGNEIVYDLYTGTGTIALYLAGMAKRVIGIEYVEEAVEDARRNALLNKIENAEFYSGDIKDILSESFIQEHGNPGVIITDPPRAGMHSDVVGSILKTGAGKIVYVSCNPATQARDLKILDPVYRVEEVQPVDMFPQTHHVENVVLLVKK